MNRYLPIGVAMALIVGTAIVQGRWSERWTEFPELNLYADQMVNVPKEIGDWKAEAKEEPSRKILDEAGAVGNLSLEYHNPRGESVSVFLVCGRLQDMFYHEPKRCYKAAGFEMQSEPQTLEIPIENGETAQFMTSRFIKDDNVNGKQDQQVYWSWTATGKWITPTEHKLAFAGQHALYKVYLVYTPTRDQTPDHNPAVDFIPQLIPALNKAFDKAIHASNQPAAKK